MHFLELFKHPYIGEVNLSIMQQPRYIIFVVVKLRIFHHTWHIIILLNKRIIVFSVFILDRGFLFRYSLIFAVLDPACIARLKSSQEQVLMDLRYVRKLLLIIAILAWTTYVTCMITCLVCHSRTQKGIQTTQELLATPVPIHPSSVHLPIHHDSY